MVPGSEISKKFLFKKGQLDLETPRKCIFWDESINHALQERMRVWVKKNCCERKNVVVLMENSFAQPVSSGLQGLCQSKFF